MTHLEVLRPFVEQTVRDFLGVQELKVMNDGTIPIRAGSAAVNVRLVQAGTNDRPILQVFSPLLSGVERTPELLDKLNEMNAGFSFARAFWNSNQVIISMELLAEEIDREQVAHACGLVTFAADYWDDELRKGFGGTIALPEDEPGADQIDEPDPDVAAPAAEGDGGYL